MKEIFLAFVVINAFGICGMPKQSQSDESSAAERSYKLQDIRFVRPVISFGPYSEIWRMHSFKCSSSTNPTEIDSIMSTEKGKFGLSFCIYKYKSVDFDNLLHILNNVEMYLSQEWLGSYEFSARILSRSKIALVRWLLERNNVKDVYIKATFPADLQQKLPEMNLENDRTYYYFGNGELPALVRNFFEILKSRNLNIDCEINIGDYDFQNKVFIMDTTFELSKN